ncbi:MAG: hypothetical protein VZR54_06805 [Ruminococcus sp.]|nr:hypothetical protein [Ruminococcus sp.]
MKKKNTARDNVNLFFSAFLIIAYIICGYFFAGFANALAGEVAKSVVYAVMFAVFGLLVFYATRVGEGKTIKRFSLVTLIVLDLPALYIVLASILGAMPLHNELAANPVVGYMAALALGYAVPYTFISGFETISDDATTEQTKTLEGGVEADVIEGENNTEAQFYDPESEEIEVEGEAIIEDIDGYVSEQEEF